MEGDIRGRDELIEWLSHLGEIGFWLTEYDVFGNDEHGCALSVMGAQHGGADVQTRVVSIFHYCEGRRVECWFYSEDLDVWEKIVTSESALNIGKESECPDLPCFGAVAELATRDR